MVPGWVSATQSRCLSDLLIFDLCYLLSLVHLKVLTISVNLNPW